MTLDEAIKHAQWVADTNCDQCAEDHRQLAEWLKELKELRKHGWHPASEPPIPDAPYISVVFCKGRNGWVPFTGYGCDISPKKTVEFINRIGDATDVLNGKEE